MIRSFVVYIAIFLMGLVRIGAADISDGAARDTAVRWVALLDAGAFKKAYLEQPPRILAYGREDNFLRWMRSRRAPLGKPKSRAFFKVTHTRTLLGAPDGNYELVIFKTSFEHKAAAAEAIILSSETGRWQVTGYQMR